MLLGIMGIAAYWDWKERKIYISLPILAIIAGLLVHVLCREQTITDAIGGAGIGLIVLLIASCSNESVGIGDGLMLIASGIFLGFQRNLELLLTALFLVGGAALFLIVVKKKKRNYTIPFLPFLLAAYLLLLG